MRLFLKFFLRQTVLVNLLFVLCMLVGVFALGELPVERYPNVRMGDVLITTILPGASPQDVETLITREIEKAVDDLENIEYIQSKSYRQRSQVRVKFIDDTDYDSQYDELRLKVLGVMKELPEGIDPPSFMQVDVSEWLPAVNINLVGDRSNRALSLMAEEMKVELRQIRGVKEVDLQGEFTREFHVDLDPALLERYGLTFDEVASALTEANLSVPAGNYENESGEFVVVVDERFRSREQIAETIIRRDLDGSFVTVGDVMRDAGLSFRDPAVISTVNGQDSVTLRLLKSPEGSALDIIPTALKIVDRFKPSLEKEGVKVVISQDQRINIDDALNTLGSNMIIGIVLVGLLIFVFMGLRNAILTTVGIPFSFLVTMILMWLTGNSLNEITLFSFVLVSGIIVDDAIVVVENIYRHVQEKTPLREAVINGTAEVAIPVIAATSTTVAAFLPMLMMTGSTGEFFAQIPIAISYAIAASLFESIIILPAHFLDWPGARRMVHTAHYTHSADNERAIMAAIRRATQGIVNFTLRHRFVCLFLVVAAFAASIVIMGLSISGKVPLIRIKFFPDEYTQYFVEAEGPMITSIEKTNEKLKEISSLLLSRGPGESKAITGQAGFVIDEDYQPEYSNNLGHLAVELPPKDQYAFKDNPDNDPVLHLENIRKALAPLAVDGWSFNVRAEPGGPPAGKDINIRVVGPNPENVGRLAKAVSSFLENDPAIGPALVNFGDDQGRPNRVYRFKVLEDRTAEYGLTKALVGRLAGSLLDGRYVGEFRTSDDDIDLKLRIAPELLPQPQDALDIPAIQDAYGPVRLRDLVSVEAYTEPNLLARYQNNRAITLTANLDPAARLSVPFVVNKVKEYYATIEGEYPGADLGFSGQFESTQRSYTSLMYAFLVAVLVIYLILATQFGSYVQPVIILSAVVFSLIGVVFGKLVTQGLFTINSFIATVGVTGVVVNDSLVLIDFINRAYKSGMNRKAAIREGIRVRLRPILLTTLTTTLGLLPMAVGIPTYSVVWGTMASTFVTGLCTATFLTLFIVPIEWDILMGIKEWAARRAGKNSGGPDNAEDSENA
ncbi:MAG: efflux RND transporter permease subunit [Desulfovibrio sp.]|uniref:efflux RND transporter permease subunit n=1 Tax=Desulfovibrio sp. 7SRBS1 TaxID=3378064 RepID=UPI003B410C22